MVATSLAIAGRSVGREGEPPTREPEIASLLGPLAAEGPRSQVLVLGTVHLARLEQRPGPDSLARLLAHLAKFRPGAICIEHLPAHDLAEMDALGGKYREVAGMFAKDDLAIGKLVRRRLGCSRAEAARRADERLRDSSKLMPETRVRLVADLLAAYDAPTALLQWSYVPPAVRARTDLLPAQVRRFLDDRLASPNETSTLAVPLARELGLARLVSVDSQWDGARLLEEPEPLVEEAFSHPLRKAIATEEVYADQRRRTEAAVGAGDLLPLYLHINSPAYAARDVMAQWAPWLRMHLASGLDRTRYGNWEARNLHIAANLVDVTTPPGSERVLVVIGVAHKPFLDDVLGRLVSVKLLQLRDLVAGTE
ncbi:MAG: DUF5694 domain-containing protein [Thermoanaerobaculia bacterium]